MLWLVVLRDRRGDRSEIRDASLNVANWALTIGREAIGESNVLFDDVPTLSLIHI